METVVNYTKYLWRTVKKTAFGSPGVWNFKRHQSRLHIQSVINLLWAMISFLILMCRFKISCLEKNLINFRFISQQRYIYWIVKINTGVENDKFKWGQVFMATLSKYGKTVWNRYETLKYLKCYVWTFLFCNYLLYLLLKTIYILNQTLRSSVFDFLFFICSTNGKKAKKNIDSNLLHYLCVTWHAGSYLTYRQSSSRIPDKNKASLPCELSDAASRASS